jgi:hypothetical protein
VNCGKLGFPLWAEKALGTQIGPIVAASNGAVDENDGGRFGFGFPCPPSLSRAAGKGAMFLMTRKWLSPSLSQFVVSRVQRTGGG